MMNKTSCKPIRRHIVFLLFAVLMVPGATGRGYAQANESPDSDGIQVALIQYAVDEETYDRFSDFRNDVRRLVKRARNEFGAEFVVFPEYINVFALLHDYDTAVDRAGTMETLLASLTTSTPLSDLLVQEISDNIPDLQQMWSDVAEEYRVWVLAGSAFVRGSDGSVKNQAWLFAPDGTLSYRQDKVFLTPEEESLGITPGRVDRARPFTVHGVAFGLTICRDGYFDVWETVHREVDVWLEIRANGELWSEAVRRRFDTAMPERVRESDTDMGLTTSLTGSFLDLVWQGPSGVVGKDGRPLFQSSIVDGTAISVVTVR